jgi:signal transduction histidine kinase
LPTYARRRGVAELKTLEADADLVHFAESLLAGAIGSASARVMVASVAKEEPLSSTEVMNILDEASQLRSLQPRTGTQIARAEAATATICKAANERLQEVDRLKDDFMSSVTHELRTPLTSIRAFSEMLRDDPKMHCRPRALSRHHRQRDRAFDPPGQSDLDMAKIESGNAEWLVEEVDLNAVVEQSAAATSQLFRDKGVALSLLLDGAAPSILADRDRLMQVVINLLSNAVKFVPANEGQVAVTLSADAAALRVSVTDNGPGIRREDQQVIFDRFRQGGDAMTSKPTGTGLGLPISRRIVEYFGGKLWVESDLGKGASFVFSLPLNNSNKGTKE